jgi:hypothetical protein
VIAPRPAQEGTNLIPEHTKVTIELPNRGGLLPCLQIGAWFSSTRFCGGIALGFKPIGAGKPVADRVGRKSAASCANSFTG